MRDSLFFSLMGAGTLTLVGCGIEPETMNSVRAAIRTASAAVEDQQPVTASTPSSFEFEPPYPDRIDPFNFPSESASEPDPGTSINVASQVVVLGFADVDGARVFLSIKGRTVSLAEGDSFHGVQVLAIHSPAVDLRRGTLQWRATMFDKTKAEE